MDEEIKDFEVVAPTLTFGSPTAEPKNEVVALETKKTIEEARLTPEEQAQVDAFVEQINLEDSNAILNYGAGTQKKLSEFSEKALSSVRAKDMGETGEMLTSLIGELRNFDVDEDEKGLKALFKKGANKAMTLKAKYSKVETNVETISNELEKHQVTLMKDIEVLDRMYDANLAYFKELTMYIEAGKRKLEATRSGKLIELQKKAEESGLQEDAQAAKDLASQCDRLRRRFMIWS